jgi:hypothetical protein
MNDIKLPIEEEQNDERVTIGAAVRNYGADVKTGIDYSKVITGGNETNDEDYSATEKKEMTEIEKKEKEIEAIKNYKLNYKPKKFFNASYRKARQKKNKVQKSSRKKNR